MTDLRDAARQLPGRVDIVPGIAEEYPGHAFSPETSGLSALNGVNLQARGKP
jgi:hypothetical protein